MKLLSFLFNKTKIDISDQTGYTKSFALNEILDYKKKEMSKRYEF